MAMPAKQRTWCALLRPHVPTSCATAHWSTSNLMSPASSASASWSTSQAGASGSSCTRSTRVATLFCGVGVCTIETLGNATSSRSSTRPARIPSGVAPYSALSCARHCRMSSSTQRAHRAQQRAQPRDQAAARSYRLWAPAQSAPARARSRTLTYTPLAPPPVLSTPTGVPLWPAGCCLRTTRRSTRLWRTPRLRKRLRALSWAHRAARRAARGSGCAEPCAHSPRARTRHGVPASYAWQRHHLPTSQLAS
mmetsp:Transcript_4233/g.10934  ORF Transcript_4233/g.10934 Transcript_4233/m.10934 type:complete len:251 (+) Transcript_4233:217-969(+)